MAKRTLRHRKTSASPSSATRPTPETARSEDTIFAELQRLCASPGYIHAIAYFCWRDNLIRMSGPILTPKDLEYQSSHDRLLRTEIATLIGLLVKGEIDLTLPPPDVMQAYVQATEDLLYELHQSMMKPWFAGWDMSSGTVSGPDPFSSASAIREPIFYSAEGAYSFQYSDLAPRKYLNDNNWLSANKGFTIEQASSVCAAVGEFQTRKIVDTTASLGKMKPNERTILPGFIFTDSEISTLSGVPLDITRRILISFSYDAISLNSTFNSLSDFNATNATPILSLAEGEFILLQHYSLVEAVYETPFFWMASDKSYAPQALKHRGDFTERYAFERLSSVFGAARTHQNVNIYDGRDRVGEIDTLVLFGDRAIVVQAKSKRLTIEARKGNDLQLQTDFQKAIQHSYDQALVCAKALRSTGLRFVDGVGTDLTIPTAPRVIFPVCLVSDHYPGLAFQARQFLNLDASETIPYPLISDIFTFDVLCELLNTPLHFINYLSLRARYADKLIVSQELAILGYHLSHNLWLSDDYTLINLDDDFTASLDIAMLARRNGAPGAKTPKGILTRFQGLTIGRLVQDIEAAGAPELTGLGLAFVQLSTESAEQLSKGIDRLVRETSTTGGHRDLSVSLDSGKSGVTVHINSLPDLVARDRLTMHCRIRKHAARAEAWYGLLLSPGTGAIRGALIHEEAWQDDPALDETLKLWPNRDPVPLETLSTGRKKIGRNDLCPCGSGRKYKKCCLRS